ncbi:MAG: hypothetical protein Q4F66_05030 [Clostridium sp.]|nr:hypothetical protein [Clostridium sp.]
MKIRNKKGYTIIESLIYIFMTTLILNEGLYLTVLMYKSYIYNAEVTKEYNDIQNFYVGFQEIASEKNISEIKCTDNKIIFLKYVNGEEKKKSIEYKSEGQGVVVRSYDPYGRFLNQDKMLGNINNMDFIKKGKLVYMIIYDKDGKEFISCV